MWVQRLDLIGAVTACVIYISSILVFSLRLAGQAAVGGVAGIPTLVAALPLVYLLITAPSVQRPAIYYVQVGLMLVWIVILFLVDFWPGLEFRDRTPLVIVFVVLYFGGMGGMIGVASLAGRVWMLASVGLFFVAAVLAFMSRWVTGM